MTKHITIQDIADTCGVSICTVSQALNGKGRISEAMRQKIWRAASQLNYHPLGHMPIAQERISKIVGLVLPNIYTESQPFFFRAISACNQQASHAGQDVKLFTISDLESRISEHHDNAQFFGFDGLVFFCCAPSVASQRLLAQKGVPMVSVRRSLHVPHVGGVLDDDEGGMRLAVEHLHQAHGHTAIALLYTVLNSATAKLRKDVFADSLALHGLPFGPDSLIHWGSPLAEIIRLKKITAVVCMHDDLALDAINALLKEGIRVPDDVAFVGYNDDSTTLQCYSKLTSVHVPVEEMVRAACEYLQREPGGIIPDSTLMRFSQYLKVRESCGCKMGEA